MISRLRESKLPDHPPVAPWPSFYVFTILVAVIALLLAAGVLMVAVLAWWFR
jgi:hypothetical protein